jgi:hypothetical protein
MADAIMKDPALLCVMCDKDGVGTCTHCRTTRYCSEACQTLDLPVHELLCKSWVMHQHPPVPGSIRAICFDRNDSVPYFVWITPEDTAGGIFRSTHEVSGTEEVEILSEAEGTLSRTMLVRNPIQILDRLLYLKSQGKGIDLMITSEGNAPNKMSFVQTNKSFEKIDRELVEYVTGDIVAFGHIPAMQKYFNLGMTDLRYIVDFLRVKYDTDVRDKAGNTGGEVVTGVRVNCWGEAALEGIYHTEAVCIAMPDKSEGQ